MSLINSPYGIKRKTTLSYDDAVKKVTETLKLEGFGILTEIDVKATLKKKLDKDFSRYLILGACNPPLAFKALTEEIDIGLLLPCNVVVYEEPGTGETVVAAIDPGTMVQVTGRKDMDDFANQVREKLTRAIESV
ncbi:MAG: DUF302 domain-containing protein [SAR324 cluster bacterium]|nr:DUF302 domain-containing protein [SAR324 cluster bacterium]MBF0352605.1 DUF302 domain-containing protein [SAR324 cluster bacterium]